MGGQRYTFRDDSVKSPLASPPTTYLKMCSPSNTVSAPPRPQSGPHPNHLKDPTRVVRIPWWTPLFGWSSNPDYLNDSNAGNTSETKPRCRYTLGSFTEEKARQLRKKTMENSSFHDMMYHSAIASRLASDISEK
ncbi:hypothetical protein GOBAR_DD26219 [Gossypium barbadense]|nr:hypothetical protein GOBAR_DD26219 [Gossypium barbadense]